MKTKCKQRHLSKHELSERHSRGEIMPASSTCKLITMDITPVFNQVLATHDGRPVQPYTFRVEDLDEFLKEAYRIVGHVAPNNGASSANCDSDHTSQNFTTT